MLNAVNVMERRFIKMDDTKLPEDMEAVLERVDLMTKRGFPVSVDDVIKETLKAGVQSIVDERMEGNYYAVRWNDNFTAFDLFDSINNDAVGEIKAADANVDYIEQFKLNSEVLWFTLDQQIGKLLGR